MTGNERDAAVALADFKTGMFDYLFSDIGTTRMVFDIDGVIYKVNNGYNLHFDGNEIEFENYLTLKDILPEGVKIPEMTLYRINGETVLAAEKVYGFDTGECSSRYFTDMPCECDGPCLTDQFTTVLEALGWNDVSWGNAILDFEDGTLWLVDVA